MKNNRKITSRCGTIEELVSEYEKYAIQHGEGTEQGNYKKANRAYDKLVKIYQQIKEQGNLAHPLFKKMLSSPDPSVRSCAALHSLAISPEEAEAVLIDVGKTPKSFVAFNAILALEEWKNGNLDDL
jgi:hypothetical protein